MSGLESLDCPNKVGEYELEQQFEDLVSYVGELKDHLVYMEIYMDERESPVISGIIKNKCEGFPENTVADFSPSTKPVSSAEEALDTLVNVMKSYSPSDALEDHSDM